jgi:hypothetical protein
MQRTTEVVTIFHSTTSDDNYKNRRAAFNRAIKTLEQSRNVAIKVLDWQENIPGGISAGRGQDRINEEVYNTFDIYFGCLGGKFGPGTVEEFEKAIESHLNLGRPTEVLFAFDETKINPFLVPDNFSKVVEFRKSIETSAKYGRSLLYFTFDDLDIFYDKLFLNLNEATRKVQMRIRGGPPRAREC